jgi:hypothetical protein
MRDLESLNPHPAHPGKATNAMCTFLALNTSSVQLIPTTSIAILVAAGSDQSDRDRGHFLARDLVRRGGGDHFGEAARAATVVSRRRPPRQGHGGSIVGDGDSRAFCLFFCAFR